MNNNPVAAISRREFTTTLPATTEPRRPNMIQRINRKVRVALRWRPPDPTNYFQNAVPYPIGYALIPVFGQAGLAAYLACCAVVGSLMLAWLCISKPIEVCQWAYQRLSPILFGPEE